MKQQRFRFKLLALFLFALFLLLAVYGGYSVLVYGNRWFASSKNPRVRMQKESVVAGSVLDRNGVVLASTDEEGNRVYQDDEDARRAIVHLLGDSEGQVANGVETFQTSYLYGFQATFPELVATLLSGEARRGDNVTLTVDSQLCTTMAESFDAHPLSRGKRGAAVVMNYLTGEVLGMTSLPSFDPMSIQDADLTGEPYWNRATQSLYPPGSTFKIITAAAALDNLEAADSLTLNCDGALTVLNQTIRDYGGASHGALALRKAFAVSCNNVFASLALTVGDDALRGKAEDFGFGDNFLFRDLVVENSAYPTQNRTAFEIASSGFGQSAITATPLHMCMVAAAVANGGVMMEPRLLQAVVSPTGRSRAVSGQRIYRTAVQPETAETLKDYMNAAVNDAGATGSRAQVSGLVICGKTGTADSELNGEAISYGWFVGFIDDERLPFAVAVLVEDIGDGTGGGSVAAPIAGDVFKYLRDHPDRVMAEE